MKNANFKEIIRRELDMMFGVEKPKKSVHMGGDDQEDSVILEKQLQTQTKSERSDSLSSSQMDT